VNSNTLSKISRESKGTHQFSARNREIYCMYSGDFGAGEFQYAIRIFKGA